MSAPLRVVFMGTPDFAVPTLKALLANPEVATVVAVYTQPDRPAGRGQKIQMPPIKQVALEHGLPVFQPESINTPDERKKLATLTADICVVIAYAQFLSTGILNIPRMGCVNVHSSLLPKFRGAAPIQYAIWNGETESGVTTMKLVQKMDAGPILLQKSIKITENMTAQELHDKLAIIGGDLLVETLKGLRDDTIEEIVQDEAKVTFAPTLKKEQGLIDWKKTGTEISRQVRAFTPWPGTFVMTNKGLLKIHRVKFVGQVQGLPSMGSTGDIHTSTGSLLVKCADGWMDLLEVQPEGKKQMTASDFINGLKNNPDFKLTEAVRSV